MSGLITVTASLVHDGMAGVVPVTCVVSGTWVPSADRAPMYSEAPGWNAVPVTVSSVPPLEGPRARLDVDEGPPRRQAHDRVLAGHERAPDAAGADDHGPPHAVVLAGPRRGRVARRVQGEARRRRSGPSCRRPRS